MRQKTKTIKPDQFILDVDAELQPSQYPQPKHRSLALAQASGSSAEDAHLTKYRDEYLDRLLRMAESGYSARAFCASVNVSYATFQHWKDCIPEFAEAADIAVMKRHYFYEHQGLLNLDNREFNCALFDRLTKAVARWKDDHVTIEHQHSHTHTLKRPEEMTAAERRERIKELTGKLNAVN